MAAASISQLQKSSRIQSFDLKALNEMNSDVFRSFGSSFQAEDAKWTKALLSSSVCAN